MFCFNCGRHLNEGDLFCPNCGVNIGRTNNNIQQQFNNVSNQPIKTNKNKMEKFFLIIGSIVVSIVVLFLIIFLFTYTTSKKLVCKSDEGNITIMYNKNGITGYTSIKIFYDLETQKQVAKKIGVDEYMIEFDKWFIANTSGYCTIAGKRVTK